MANRAILATRELIPMTLRSGSFLDLSSFDGAWPCVGVDYGNIGKEENPPPLEYVNIVNDTVTGHAEDALGSKIGILLPLSAEAQIVDIGTGLIQYRHPRWSNFRR